MCGVTTTSYTVEKVLDASGAPPTATHPNLLHLLLYSEEELPFSMDGYLDVEIFIFTIVLLDKVVYKIYSMISYSYM